MMTKKGVIFYHLRKMLKQKMKNSKTKKLKMKTKICKVEKNIKAIETY